MKILLKNNSFILLFSGALVSSIGTTLYGFAAALYVQSLFPAIKNSAGEVIQNDGAFYLGLVMAVSIGVRVIFSPLAGVFVDKLNKIRIIYMTDFVRGAIFIVTLLILRQGLDRYEILYLFLVSTALVSLNEALFGPAVTAAIPEIVGSDQIQAANGAQSIVGSLQSIIGIIAGMALYVRYGIEVAILVNAVSFIMSGLSEMFIRAKYKENAQNEVVLSRISFFSEIKFGFKYLIEKEGLLMMMIYSLFLNFAFSPFFSIGLTALFEGELEMDNSAVYLGWVNIAFSVAMLVSGILVGSMVFKSLTNVVRRGLALMALAFFFATLTIYLLTYGVIGFTVFYVLFITVNIVLAVAMIVINVPLNTGMIKAIEPSVRGRVFSTIQSIAGAAIPFSMIIGGAIVRRYNVATLGIFCVIVMLFPLFGFLTNKKVKILLDGFGDNDATELQEAI